MNNDFISFWDDKESRTVTYSTVQMNNFYKDLGQGKVKESGIMNYIQHLLIVDKLQPGDTVIDICCGRGLILPVLKHSKIPISNYLGVDISSDNLLEAKQLLSLLDEFTADFIQGDVTKLTQFTDSKFDVVVYTSALEHLDRISAIRSLKEVVKVMKDSSTLYLSTPITPKNSPKNPQYKVHVYEWDRQELLHLLSEIGLIVKYEIGLLPPIDEILSKEISEYFGEKALLWYETMKERIPFPFLSTILASSFPSVAKETMFVCKKEEVK